MRSVLVEYLREIAATRGTGISTPETSFYPAVKALFDAVGRDVDPKVFCVMNLRNQGAGLPDGGLFTPEQLGRRSSADDVETILSMTKPARGAIEVKPPSKDIGHVSKSEQATRYGGAYRHVLLTNLREFALLAHAEGKTFVIERFVLASSEQEFWNLCANPAKARDIEAGLLEFLRRVIRTPAPLAEPEDVAWFLASYARDALVEIEHAPIPGLTDVAAHLEAALGVGFGFASEADTPLASREEKERAQHFFRSILIQTLFYGIFSAWVLWCRQGPDKGARFSWRETSGRLNLTVLSVLFHEMTRPTALFSKILQKRLELAEAMLDRVDRVAFFKRFQQHEAVQYFYEPFLIAFDPQLRKDLGVWYTPDEVVRYIVERVDRALRTELGIAAGLADPNVLVLDPCCGTGAFLVAVLERIHKTAVENGEESLVAAQVLEAAKTRIFGFEILPAPFVVAHLQVSLYLDSIGARLTQEQRAAIYLTNALTGWDPQAGKQVRLWEGLEEERDQANRVKRKKKILVVLGNPPYNAFAGVQPHAEGQSVEAYKKDLGSRWGIRKFNLDDLYVRFLRLAERKIVDQSGHGIVCYVSNASYVADKSFVVLRERFLREFDSVTIDNCNGDSRETGKLTPDGKPDPSIFSTKRNREGIRVGTAIGLFALSGAKKRKKKKALATVRWRDFWGEAKRQDLLESLDQEDSYKIVKPSAESYWSFKPLANVGAYAAWPRIVDLCGHEPFSGLAEMRKSGLISADRDVLVQRMKAFFDRNSSWDSVRGRVGTLAFDAADYPAQRTRETLLKGGEAYSENAIRRYALLPFDYRWCYWSNARPLWNRARPQLEEQARAGGHFFITRTNAERPGEQHCALCTTAMPDYHLLRPNVVAIPFRWAEQHMNKMRITANLSERARRYLRRLGIKKPDETEVDASLIWHHALAICFSPAWFSENGQAILADFPRVPLPGSRDHLEHSAAIGRQVAMLLDPDTQVQGVTSGKIRDDLRPLGSLRRADGRPQIDPSSGDLAVSARWGVLQRGTVVMPGPGRITDSKGASLQSHPLGPRMLDVWLNDAVYIQSVPERVWDFTVGGYQVIKKWLSYREKLIWERDLTLDEARHLTNMVRRISALLLLEPALDASYRDARDNHIWPCDE